MKLLFNLLRLIHIVLPSSRQPNWRYGSARLQQSCKRYGTWYGTVSKRPKRYGTWYGTVSKRCIKAGCAANGKNKDTRLTAK